MKRWRKVGLIVAIPVILIGGLWGYTCWNVYRAEQSFRRILDPRKAHHPLLVDYEWATIFQGHAGLHRLRLLSHDPSSSDLERWTAGQAADYIRDGRYLKEIQWLGSIVSFGRDPLFRTELWCSQLSETLFSVVYPAE